MSKPKFSGVASKVVRATTKLSSWLHALKISHSFHGTQFIILDKKGNRPRTPYGGTPIVQIYEIDKPENAIGLKLDDFWQRDIQASVKAFNEVTQLLGLGSPNPLPNRAASEELTHHDFWIRHREVAVSPNPDPEVFEKYRQVISNHVNVFYSGNKRLLWEVGLEKDDVRSIIMMWVISFECIHKMPVDVNNTNVKLLNTHLKQRLIELHTRIESQSKKAGYDAIPEETLNHKLNTLVKETVEEESVVTIEAADSKERRRASKSMLKDVLFRMPKSFAVKKLEEISKTSKDRSVVDLALKQLAELRQANESDPELV